MVHLPTIIFIYTQDVGALEDVKDALKELVMLPLQRPELFRKVLECVVSVFDVTRETLQNRVKAYFYLDHLVLVKLCSPKLLQQSQAQIS